jgi:streptomycin 6-kinase
MIPNILINYFPTIYNVNDNIIIMEKIEGITLSQLLVSKTLTEKHLVKLLDTVKNIYNIQKIDNKNIYLNYSSKIEKRYLNNQIVYSKLHDSHKIFAFLKDKLKEYEDKNLGLYSSLIHGDLVFSNIILTYENNYKFIDPRGKLGENLTLEGDIQYDLAKILQSLYGYDFIILKRSIDYTYLKKLREVFNNWVKNNFKDVDTYFLKILCLSLFFTLIPLHDEENYRKFLDIIAYIDI